MRARIPVRTRLGQLLVTAALVTAALAAAWPAAASAQRAADLLPAGARVQLVFRGAAPTPVPAEFVRAGGDTLWVRYPGAADTAALARANLRELRVYQGHGPRRVGRGAGLGLLAGAGVGAAVGAVMAAGDPGGAAFVGGPAGAMALMAGVGALPGVVIGALVSTGRPEVWVRVPLR